MDFIVYTEDEDNSLHIRQAVRDDHLAWLNNTPSHITLLTAGPWLDDEDVMRGSLLIVGADTKQAVINWLSNDPYKSAGLTKSVMVKTYKWVIGKPEAT